MAQVDYMEAALVASKEAVHRYTIYRLYIFCRVNIYTYNLCACAYIYIYM